MPVAPAALPVVRAGSARHEAPSVGGWLTVQTRERKGRPVGKTMSIGGQQVTVNSGLSRWLTYTEMWTIYRRVPDVRACVDSIVRRIATWDWLVEPAVDPADPEYESLLDVSEEQRRFLQAPNTDGETWQELITKVATDLLTFDQASIEPVKSRDKSKLKELVAIRGSTVCPKRDEMGRLTGYVQDYAHEDGGLAPSSAVTFKPDELIFLRLFPTTAGSEGNSLMESLVDEVVTVLRAAEHTMYVFDADEVPPGIVVLAGIAGQAATKAVEDLRSMRGQDHKIRVITTPDPTNVGAKWVELRHTPKDLSMREIVNDIRRVIWRVFGVMPVEMGMTEDIPRASAEVQLAVSTSHLVNPILEMLEAKINARILPLLAPRPELVGKTRFRFDRDTKMSPAEQKEQATRLEILVKQGILTRNEARAELGYKPLDGGDIATVEGNPRKLDAILTDAGEIKAPDEEPDDDTDPDGGGGSDGGDDGEAGDPEAGSPDGDDEAPGEAEKSTQAVVATPDHRMDGETMQECIARKLPEVKAADPRAPLDAAIARCYDICGAAEPNAEPGSDRKGRHDRHVHTETCGCAGAWGNTHALVTEGKLSPTVGLLVEAERAFRRARDLPSDWQPYGRFRNYRTLDLSKLGDTISRYAIDVRPLWREARDEIVAALAAAYDADRGGFTEDTAADALRRVDDACDRLEVRWRAAVGPRYKEAAKVGRDAASDFTGLAEVADGWETQAELYFQQAMSYLTAEDGPIKTAKRAVQAVVNAAMRHQRASAAPPDTRASELDAILQNVVDEATLLATAEAAFNGQEFRLYHWSGKLNDLSNKTLVNALNAHAVTEGKKVAVWYAEWVYVGDKATCSTCEQEGFKGIRPLSDFKTQPGGDTECRGNCRCVLVVWTKEEVDSGRAERLGPTGGSVDGAYAD